MYWLLDRRANVHAAAAVCRRAAAQLDGGIAPEEAAERLSHLFLTGWPHHPGTPWINLHVSRFTWRVKRALGESRAPVRRSPRRPARLRAGLLADLGSTLTFSPQFFERVPEGVELAAFDVGGSGRTAGYLDRLANDHYAFDPGDTAAVGAAIEASDLDLLLCDVYKTDLDAILDRITVPCIVDVCTTVKLRFHPNVSFHLYCLQQADYLVRANRMFCATSESYLDRRVVYSGALLFDRRNLDPRARRPWREREPLLVYHGKLYKLSDTYLEAVLGLLADDPALQLALMGRDDGQLEGIRAAAARHGVAGQLHYEGEFRVDRNEQGEVDDPSWLRLADLLSRARLAPDPWPLGGASSRIEAYAAGAPVVHMGIRTDPASWRRPQLAVTADHPALEIASLTAYTVDEYVAIARRALYDEEFADPVAEEQAQRAGELTDGAAFWTQILSRYREWLAATGSAPASSDRGFRTESSTPSPASH